MPLKILLVEDDPVDASIIQEELGRRISASITTITTEREFRERFPDLCQNPPDVIILDIMLRWAKPSPEMTEASIPQEVRENGFFAAGLRCVDLLQTDPRTSRIPYIIYSGLDKDNFTRHVVHTKSGDFSLLLEEIRKVTGLS